MGRLFVGPAGWSYPHWAGVVYPRPRPISFDPLTFLAERFQSVEVNSSFHRPLEAAVTQRWLSSVSCNPEFLFTVKLGRQFTHERVMADSAVAFFKEGLWPLVHERRLGAVMMQFPPDFRLSADNLRHLLNLRRAFHEFPLAAEMRHESWLSDEGLAAFIDHRITWVNRSTRELTCGTAYFRVHEESPDLHALHAAVTRVAAYADRTFVVFTCDRKAASVLHATAFQRMLGRTVVEPNQPELDFGRAVA